MTRLKPRRSLRTLARVLPRRSARLAAASSAKSSPLPEPSKRTKPRKKRTRRPRPFPTLPPLYDDPSDICGDTDCANPNCLGLYELSLVVFYCRVRSFFIFTIIEDCS